MGASLRANISKTVGVYRCKALRSQSQSCPPLGTAKIIGLPYPCWDRGGAKVVKLNENFKIVDKFLCP